MSGTSPNLRTLELESGTRHALAELTPLNNSRSDPNSVGPREGCLQRLRGFLALKTTMASFLAVLALVFIAGMALLGVDLHWGGLGLVSSALLVLVVLCLIPVNNSWASPQGGLGRLATTLPSEPLPVSMCAHLQLKSTSADVVPYPLQEFTLADVSRMYPPPFPPPPYQDLGKN